MKGITVKTIVFIHQLNLETAEIWLPLIKQNLPYENVKLPEELSQQEKEEVEIAIIAGSNAKCLVDYPNLVWIQSLWAGVENIVQKLPSKNIKLVRLIDPKLSKTMAEAVLAWTLYLHRNMPEYSNQQMNRLWKPIPLTPTDQFRISVMGTGELGLASINILKNFGYQVNCWSRNNKNINGVNNYCGKNGLTLMLKQTDVLVSLLPLTQQTHHLLNKENLLQLPSGAKIINFSRGAIIDIKALTELLDSQHFSHAVLDVFEQEPLPIDDKTWVHPNITVLPHISAPTNINTAVKIVAHNILEYRKSNTVSNAIDTLQGY